MYRSFRRSPRLAAFVLFAGVLGGCVDPSSNADASDPIDAPFPGKADGPGISSADACAALRVANEATRDALDDDAGLDARAARGIAERRPFANLDELDAVPYVGQTVLVRLVEYAADQGIACETAVEPLVRGRIVDTRTVHDEWRPGQPIAYTFWAQPGTEYDAWANGPGTRNSPVLTIVGPLDATDPSFAGVPTIVSFESETAPTAFTVPQPGVYGLVMQESQDRAGFVDFGVRPLGWGIAPMCDAPGFCDCFEDSDCGDGAVCLPLQYSYAPAGLPSGKCAPTFPAPYQSDTCSEPGGVYRTVEFTPEEACATLDALNHAPYSVFHDRSRGWHRLIFFSGPGEAGTMRVSRWTSLAQVARQTVEFGSLGSATLSSLKAVAANADYSEPTTDTVASTYADRFDRDGEEVVLENALVADADPAEPPCGRLRDHVGGSRYLRVCADDGAPLAPLVGQRVFVSGILSYRDGAGGWTIDATRVLPQP